jgi:hypothetical protein
MEQILQNKKLILMMSVLVLLVSAAAFIAGRSINGGFGPSANAASISVNIIPAIELPTIPAGVTGQFVERQDNAILIETKSLDGGGSILADSPSDRRSTRGPQVEVVVTGDTIIYRETTQLSKPLTSGNQAIQQTVEQTTFEQLNPASMIMVWGRKSGDRIVAEVLLYSNPAMIKQVIFEDCNVCP